MDLIEQLGGYEKAKGALKWLEKNNPVHDWMKPKLQEDILKYRRQHNVFEVGDKVVFNSYELDAGIREIQDYHNGCIGAVFRHATDAEIAAGHRL